MTLVSSGNQILLKGTSDTNPTSNVPNELYSRSMSTGYDALLTMTQLVETGDGQFTPTTVWQGDMYGFNSSSSNFSSSSVHGQWSMNAVLAAGEARRYSSQSAYGSLGSTTYSDNSSTTRTIKILTWGVPDGAPSPNTNFRVFCFALSGTSVTNSDNTFEKLEITTNGGTTVTINRTDLTYDSSEAGNSWWAWHGSSGTMYNNVGSLGTPSSGTSYTVKIISGTTTTTLNTGISEEMSGGTDTDPIEFSDYYKDAVYHATTGIPTSGEIKFSDFYGKTKQAIVTNLAEGTFTSTYTQGQYVTTSGWSFNTAISPSSSTLDDGFSSALRGAGTGDVQLNGIYNIQGSGAGTIYVYFKRTNGSTGTFTNTGWSNLRIYLNQTNNSGSPDLTLTRTGATGFGAGSSSGNSGYYYYTSSSYASLSTYFGTGSNETHYVELD